MIKKIHFIHYRKLKNLDIEFTKNINIISGTNGTCKTSILHLCSNAFKAPKKDYIANDKVITTINNINMLTNPKIETLTKGDKKFNNPAPDFDGPLFNITYFDGVNLDFRRHNTDSELSKHKRYRIILKYPKGKKMSLKTLATIYLGLPRLFPFGELDDKEKKDKQYDKMQNIINTLSSEKQKELNKVLKEIEKKQTTNIKNIAYKLPDEYQEELYKLYKDLTGISITRANNIKVENIKSRTEFDTDTIGIDSNTISAGEDNIMIILTALVSLKYYYNNISNKDNEVISMLLIDELDATLHPEMQIKIFNQILEYSRNYKIQVIFTSHSFTLIEHAKKNKQNLIYIQNKRTTVKLMENPDIYKIKMDLYNETSINLFKNSKIPVFTEDDEARFVLNILFSQYKIDLNNLFHLVKANMGNTCITQIFEDEYMYKNTVGLIAILDGDCKTNMLKETNEELDNNTNSNRKDYTYYFNHNIMWLPGDKSPEILFFEYALNIYNDESSKFHNFDDVQNHGYSYKYFDNYIKPHLEECLKIENASDKRKKAKKIFKEFSEFFKCIITYWIIDENNLKEVNKFYSLLKSLYKKNADINNCNPNFWN